MGTDAAARGEFTKGVVKNLPPGDEQIVVAARDLPAGTRLTRDHLTTTLAAPLLQLWVVTPATIGVGNGAKLGVALKQGAPLFFTDLR
ncbi:MAG: SAF domain-containing protein [Archangium sp.]|nr:SAF domain-containing protein [Archangium sp.]MDP3153960.1 SAF domain-containing protein [Archangium sp.]MDP3574235.1 SAF domain-containing protein [Archangium sp.]